ncbi:MAG: hypothetical protein ABI947_13425 [Chloroflexota bacterium]
MPQNIPYFAKYWPVAALLLLSVAGCQLNNPPGPTTIPTITVTQIASVTQTLTSQPGTTLPVTQVVLLPVITSTALAPTPAPVVEQGTAAPTPGPRCYVAQKGDSLVSLITKAGYADLSVLPAVRAENNICPSCNDIQVGQTYCIPLPTATPTAQGAEATIAAQQTALGSLPTKISATTTYTVVENDNIIAIQIKTGATLHELCELNNPDPINCGGCQIDKPIGQQGCRPPLRLGAIIKIPGPTPTPTITPTLTGSETATPTPPYPSPIVVSPAQGAKVAGASLQLVWLTSGILHPDESYLVLMTDVTNGSNHQFETQATSLRLPANMQPTDGKPHTFNWQVGVARKSADGVYVQEGEMSLIYTFTWQTQ